MVWDMLLPFCALAMKKMPKNIKNPIMGPFFAPAVIKNSNAPVRQIEPRIIPIGLTLFFVVITIKHKDRSE